MFFSNWKSLWGFSCSVLLLCVDGVIFENHIQSSVDSNGIISQSVSSWWFSSIDTLSSGNDIMIILPWVSFSFWFISSSSAGWMIEHIENFSIAVGIIDTLWPWFSPVSTSIASFIIVHDTGVDSLEFQCGSSAEKAN